MRRIIILIFVSISIIGCTSIAEKNQEFEKQRRVEANKFPRYEIMLVPINDAALEMEEEYGRYWVIPEYYKEPEKYEPSE